jgi:hypothetical protein
LVTPQLEREPSLLRHFGQSGGNSPATPADFDPNGFRSSSPTTPATQSVSPMCGTRQARPATHAHGASNHDRGGFAAVIAIRRQKIKASISLTPSAPPTPGANADGKRIT